MKLGRYRLDSKIAEGGMASVWRGFDEDLHRAVAVKVMRDVIQKDAVFAERFVSRMHPELRPSQHPLGLRLRLDADVYLVLPLIEGGSLRDWLGAPIPLPLVVDWLAGRSPRDLPMRTRTACCTATSSRPTSW